MIKILNLQNRRDQFWFQIICLAHFGQKIKIFFNQSFGLICDVNIQNVFKSRSKNIKFDKLKIKTKLAMKKTAVGMCLFNSVQLKCQNYQYELSVKGKYSGYWLPGDYKPED